MKKLQSAQEDQMSKDATSDKLMRDYIESVMRSTEIRLIEAFTPDDLKRSTVYDKQLQRRRMTGMMR